MQKRHLQIDGNSIAVYESGGSGPAILLIHGRSMDARTFRHQPGGGIALEAADQVADAAGFFIYGAPPMGKQVTITGISIYRVADGKVVEGSTSADMLGLMQQLGAVPAPREAG